MGKEIRILLVLLIILLGCNGNDFYDPNTGDEEPPVVEPPFVEPPDEPGDTDEPEEPINPDCKDVMSPGSGFLWKPKSESTGKPVILFPQAFEVPFDSVKVQKEKGGYDFFRFNGFANGDRQHWYGGAKPKAYEKPAFVIASQETGECVWKVKDPKKRAE